MKRLFLILSLPILAMTGCSSDDDGASITTEAVVERDISGLSTGSVQTPDEVFFNFETGLVVPDDKATGKNWDISFKRYDIRLNGGTSGSGNAGLVISQQEYAAITEAPENGYVEDGDGPDDESGLGATSNLAFTNWFEYTDTVTPKDQTYIIRTAKNKYVKMVIHSYYGPGINNGGVYSFTYTLQPGGSRVLADAE